MSIMFMDERFYRRYKYILISYSHNCHA
jgi:hypothetical protein